MSTGTIVCAIDETEGAAQALRTAAHLCGRLDLRLVAVHVLADAPVSAAARREARAGGIRLVDRVRAEQGAHTADRRVTVGDPAEQIARIAGEEGAELILVGSNLNRRQPPPPLRSRVATELPRITPIPVVVVPPGARTPNRAAIDRDAASPRPETIIIPLEGAGSEPVLPAATGIARRFRSRVVLVHVHRLITDASRGEPLAHLYELERDNHVREIAARLRADGFDVDVETHTVIGSPAAVIADAARRHHAYAIVLATRGHSPFLGAAQRLLHRAPCAVVAVPTDSSSELLQAGDCEAVAV